jgi:metallo-beta-lactamase family protein
MKLTFWGAAGDVTGSRHYLESGGKRYLLDCGMYQGHRKEAEARNRDFPFPPESVAAVVLSHAHIDHSGNLPLLVKNGFAGPIYATPATIDLCGAMLRDTAHIQERDCEFVNRRRSHRRAGEGAPVEPLYTMADAERTLPLFQPVSYYSAEKLDEALSYQAYDAGHMLGSSCIALEDSSSGKSVRLTFSGDVGRPNAAGRLPDHGEHLRRAPP